jgi:hypothetical protein
MGKRTPGAGTWPGLASISLLDSDSALLAGYWSPLWAFTLSLGRHTAADAALGAPAGAAPASGGADQAVLAPLDSPTGASPAGFDPAAASGSSPIAPAAAGPTGVSRSGNQNIDGVLSGVKWNGPVTYSFPDAPGDYPFPYAGGDFEPTNPEFQQVSTAQMQAVRHFLEGIAGGPGSIYNPVEGFTNLSFTELAIGSGGADIMIAQSPTANPTAYGHYPGNLASAGDVWFGTNFDYRDPILGTYEYASHLHEV